MNLVLRAILIAQRTNLVIAYWWYRAFDRRDARNSIDWVVGCDELASMVYQIGHAIPRSFTVSFTQDGAYDLTYDYGYRKGTSPRRRARWKLLIGPFLLGKLMNRARGFLYFGPTGFLMENFDRRVFEFAFLKKHGKRIALYWSGSDIRSTALMHELEHTSGQPNISTYIGQITPYFETPEHEAVQRERARVTDVYADVVFNFPTDQRSYITRHQEPYFYLMPEDRVVDSSAKFEDLSRLVLTHATTSPIIKGTALVRAAVEKLRAEGYDFEYIELIGVGNTELLEVLGRTHIALNQFYGFTTTIFGVEALAARCVLLASSDGTVETYLPPHANDAMMVTKHWQVYDNLKYLLDDPARIEPLARAGQEWVKEYASGASNGPRLSSILNLVLDGNYNEVSRRLLTIDEIFGPAPRP
ncbi:MAG: glycosyltransferase [Terrimesophilobacter sp.]